MRTFCPAVRCGLRDVAAQTAGVVAQAVEGGVRGEVGHDWGDGAEIDGPAVKGFRSVTALERSWGGGA
jgi:hypothetical protein